MRGPRLIYLVKGLFRCRNRVKGRIWVGFYVSEICFARNNQQDTHTLVTIWYISVYTYTYKDTCMHTNAATKIVLLLLRLSTNKVCVPLHLNQNLKHKDKRKEA